MTVRLQTSTDKASAFSPSSPIRDATQLIGRQKEVTRCIDAISTPGTHVAVYGARGSGKTSLLNVVLANLSQDNPNLNVVRYTCSHGDTYREIFGFYLAETGQHTRDGKSLTVESRDLTAEAQIPFAKGGVKSSRTVHMKTYPIWDIGLRPYALATRYLSSPSIYVIDEFDRIRDEETLTYISDTIKILADLGSPTRLVLLGVANSAQSLVGKHASIARSLRSVGLSRLEQSDLEHILDLGFRTLNMECDRVAKNYMTLVANGLPYFVHLLGAEIARHALANGHDRVTIQDCASATDTALVNVVEYVKAAYENFCYPTGHIVIDFGRDRSRMSLLRELIAISVAIHGSPSYEELSEAMDDLVDKISTKIKSLSRQDIDRYWISLLDYSEPEHDELVPIIEADTESLFVIRRDGNALRIEFVDPALRSYALLRLASIVGSQWISERIQVRHNP